MIENAGSGIGIGAALGLLKVRSGAALPVPVRDRMRVTDPLRDQQAKHQPRAHERASPEDAAFIGSTSNVGECQDHARDGYSGMDTNAQDLLLSCAAIQDGLRMRRGLQKQKPRAVRGVMSGDSPWTGGEPATRRSVAVQLLLELAALLRFER